MTQNAPSSRRRSASFDEAKIILFLTFASSGDLSQNASSATFQYPTQTT